MRKYIKFNIALLVLATIVSCSDKRERQYQYMPDMYVAVPYEADAEKGNTGFSSNLKPVSGTIPLIAEKIILSFNGTFNFANSLIKNAEGIAKIKTWSRGPTPRLRYRNNQI